MINFFSYLGFRSFVGFPEDFEEILERPLQKNETLRMNKNGQFHRLKIPTERSPFIYRVVFWIELIINPKNHLEAINSLINQYELLLFNYPNLSNEDFARVEREIDCLRSLKNDYALQCLNRGDPELIEQRIINIERKAEELLKKHQAEKRDVYTIAKEKVFLSFFKESRAIIHLLLLEGRFGHHETAKLFNCVQDDLPYLFHERVNHLQARLMLARQLEEDIRQIEKYVLPLLDASAFDENEEMIDHLPCLESKLDSEVNEMEVELETLLLILKDYLNEHPLQTGLYPYDERLDPIDYKRESPVMEKIEVLEKSLELLRAA